MGSWSFNLREKVQRTDSDSSSASSNLFTSSPSCDPSSEAELFNDLDFSMREEPDGVPEHKPNPFSIARINAATRKTALIASATYTYQTPDPLLENSRQTAVDITRGHHTIDTDSSQTITTAETTREVFKPARRKNMNGGTIWGAFIKQRGIKNLGTGRKAVWTRSGQAEGNDRSSAPAGVKTLTTTASSTISPPNPHLPSYFVAKSDNPQAFTTPGPRKSELFRSPAPIINVNHRSSTRVTPAASFTSRSPRYVPLQASKQSSQAPVFQNLNAQSEFPLFLARSAESCSRALAHSLCVSAGTWTQSTPSNVVTPGPNPCDASTTRTLVVPSPYRPQNQQLSDVSLSSQTQPRTPGTTVSSPFRSPVTSSPHDRTRPGTPGTSSPFRSPVVTMLKLTTLPESNTVRATPISRKRVLIEEDEEHYGERGSPISSSPPLGSFSPPRKKWRMTTATQEEDAEWSTLNVGKKSKKRDTLDQKTGKFSLGWLSLRR